MKVLGHEAAYMSGKCATGGPCCSQSQMGEWMTRRTDLQCLATPAQQNPVAWGCSQRSSTQHLCTKKIHKKIHKKIRYIVKRISLKEYINQIIRRCTSGQNSPGADAETVAKSCGGWLVIVPCVDLVEHTRHQRQHRMTVLCNKI